MALLHRFLKVSDEADTGIFTFIGTKTVTRDLHRDVTSKEFTYGHHRWAVTFLRADGYLGALLLWRSPSTGTRVSLDVSFTLLNRHDFEGNCTVNKVQVLFSHEIQDYRVARMVSLASLSPSFSDRNGELLLEVALGRARTSFEHCFRVNQSIFTNSKLGKMETDYFAFGNHDWSIALYPTARADSQLGCVESGGSVSGTSVYLNRHTGLDRTCRVRFSLTLGSTADAIESGAREEVSDADGKSFGWMLPVKMADLVSKNLLRLLVNMEAVNTLSEVDLPIHPASPIGIPLYDSEKLAWEMEADVAGDTLRMRLRHQDVKNIPRNHIRCVSFSVYLLRSHPKLQSALGESKGSDYKERVPLDQTLFLHHFVQEESDCGTLVDSKIAIKEIMETHNGYLCGRNVVQVQVEWLHSCLLFQSSYQHYDDVARIQGHQMRTVVEALRLENERLVRRLQAVGIHQDEGDDDQHLVKGANRTRREKRQ